MKMRHGQHKRDEFCGNPQLTYSDAEHIPSWTIRGDGWCEVRLILFDQGLSIDVTEAHKRAGRSTTKRTMETLDEAATRALYEMLKERFA